MPRLLRSALLLCALGRAVGDVVVGDFGGHGDFTMPLTLLTDAQGKDRGAVCLDGSNPGFYFRAAPANSSDGSGGPNPHATDWVVYMKGGGWCYNEKDCLQRSKTDLGSSAHFPDRFGFSGLLDPDPAVNPDFADFNHVLFYYCDGVSFTGNVSEPVKVGDEHIYFRGRVVLEALLDVVDAAPYGMRNATAVLVAGGSAGGLSTYLHADYIAGRYKATAHRVGAAPVSGFFLMHDDFNSSAATYRDNMRYAFHMANAEGGVNQHCVAAQQKAGEETWPCIFANYSYEHSTTPFFMLQSAIDSWQMSNIWRNDLKCYKGQFEACTPAEITDLNGWEADFVRDLHATSKFGRAGEGGFVESCYEHVGMQSAANFDGYEIGGVRARAALGKWWASSGADPSADHFYLPCTLDAAAEPHQCNPTCLKPDPADYAQDFYND